MHARRGLWCANSHRVAAVLAMSQGSQEQVWKWRPTAREGLGLVAIMAVTIVEGKCPKRSFLEVKGLKGTNW